MLSLLNKKIPQQSVIAFFGRLCIGVILAVVATLLQVIQPQQVVFASGLNLSSSTVQSSLTPDKAPTKFAQEKQQLSYEYNGMLHGKESQAQFEQHYLAFMNKWNLGNTQNLHTALVAVCKG